MTVYTFSAPLLNGEHVSLDKWRGRVLLIVNTASHCGLTPQYAGLQKLHEKLEGEGLTVLGFPCNQFMSQELGSESEITRFCRENFGVTFPMFSRVKVNGGKAHPLFRHLKTKKRGLLGTPMIKWNFTKFLIDREGHPVARYAPKIVPESLEDPIRKLL
ncbi:MAG: glutathione peroxidase [Alphaproteobacteria bacterium]|nr:glutathione peroxidase [Alphaproteobacteria bacterium]